MSKALFITDQDLKRFSIISGNVDDDKLIQFISIAQDIHIQNYLGTPLFEKFETEIIAGTLANPYLALMNDYVKNMVIHWSMVEILPFIAYTVAAKGIFKHTSENSEVVSKSEVDYLVARHRDIAENYTRRFIDYMCYNSTTFPEYVSATNNDVRPSTSASYGGWVLNTKHRKKFFS